MTYTYKEIENEFGAKSILKTDENGNQWSIPIDSANSDYQRYLNLEAEQSTPMIPGDE
jgi:hypothetical protein